MSMDSVSNVLGNPTLVDKPCGWVCTECGIHGGKATSEAAAMQTFMDHRETCRGPQSRVRAAVARAFGAGA